MRGLTWDDYYPKFYNYERDNVIHETLAKIDIALAGIEAEKIKGDRFGVEAENHER